MMDNKNIAAKISKSQNIAQWLYNKLVEESTWALDWMMATRSIHCHAINCVVDGLGVRRQPSVPTQRS